jgi:hypothetical protein
MKKKTTSQSAFFNPRSLCGFLLCSLGLSLLILAITGLDGGFLKAAVANAPDAAPQNHIGVAPVTTLPLREIPPITPSLAPGHNHPEPIIPPGPTLGAGADIARQAT